MIYVNKGEAPRFKKDWTEAIKKAYKNKCAYCEQKGQEIMNIEHYRPKAQYDWLKESWENMLCSCPKCNSNKSDKFPIAGTKITEDTLHADYMTIEKPLLLNPENETHPENHFRFTTNGKIIGVTTEGETTVDICGLNRNTLIEKRKPLFDNLKSIINEYVLLDENAKIKEIIEKFIAVCKKQETEFLAFHKFILKHELKKMYNIEK